MSGSSHVGIPFINYLLSVYFVLLPYRSQRESQRCEWSLQRTLSLRARGGRNGSGPGCEVVPPLLHLSPEVSRCPVICFFLGRWTERLPGL